MTLPNPNFPLDIPSPDERRYVMILDDHFIIENIDNTENIELQFQEQMKMRPVPVRSQITVTNYTAVNVCDKDKFRIFYSEVLGKSIRMSFEGYSYRGYMHNLVEEEFDFTFSFTHSSRIAEPPIDPFFLGRR